METLPPEMVAMIGQYLPVEDLASCCAVSPEWREMFGCDEVWRPRCDADSEEYLRTTSCRVEPKFMSPESENSTLSPIGRWRIAYMREKHLWKNWMNGNFVNNVISDTCQQVIFINNDFVIAVNADFIRLIDTTVKPPGCVASRGTNGSTDCEVSVVRSDTFIIWDGKNTVQIIGVAWESYALSVKHSFCVSGGNGITKYAVVNTVFVGLDKDLLHIWDLEKATKLKTESCLDGFEFINVGHDKKCENLGIINRQFCNLDDHLALDYLLNNVLRINPHNYVDLDDYVDPDDYDLRSYFSIYNVKELRFWPFTKHSPTEIDSFAIVGHYVALALDDSVEVYNYQTSQCLQTVVSCESTVSTMGNCFIVQKVDQELVKISPSTGVVTCLHSDIFDFDRCNENLFFIHPEEEEPQLWKVQYDKSTVNKVILKDSYMFSYYKVTSNHPCSKVIQHNGEFWLRAELFTFW